MLKARIIPCSISAASTVRETASVCVCVCGFSTSRTHDAPVAPCTQCVPTHTHTHTHTHTRLLAHIACSLMRGRAHAADFRVERDPLVLANATAVWKESGVLSWLSCEQNLNHFFGETLGPAHRAASADHLRNISLIKHPEARPHLIITNGAMWPNPAPE